MVVCSIYAGGVANATIRTNEIALASRPGKRSINLWEEIERRLDILHFECTTRRHRGDDIRKLHKFARKQWGRLRLLAGSRGFLLVRWLKNLSALARGRGVIIDDFYKVPKLRSTQFLRLLCRHSNTTASCSQFLKELSAVAVDALKWDLVVGITFSELLKKVKLGQY